MSERACDIRYVLSGKDRLVQYKYARTLIGRFNVGKRRIGWKLSFVQYSNLMKKPCTYCGSLITGTSVGLDRIDNNKGYTKENVLPCCGECNRIRSNKYSVEEMRRIGRILSYNISRRNQNVNS